MIYICFSLFVLVVCCSLIILKQADEINRALYANSKLNELLDNLHRTE